MMKKLQGLQTKRLYLETIMTAMVEMFAAGRGLSLW